MTFKQFILEKYASLESPELCEAVFSEKNLQKVMKLYGKLFSKQFNSKFYPLGEEEFSKPGTKGYGFRFINQQGYQIRFNWDKSSVKDFKLLDKASAGEKLYLSSIDYWEPINDNFARPSTTVNFFEALNVVQIWEKVSKLIKRGVRGKYTLRDLVGQEGLHEANVQNVSAQQKVDFMKKAGFKTADAYHTSKQSLQKMLDDDPELQAKFDNYVLEITEGKEEQNSFNDNIEDSKKKFDKKVYCDPDLVFKDIEALTEFIAKKGSKSLVICGLAGVGKTYHVTSTLKQILGEEGIDWSYHSGMKTAPFTIYKTIFQERDKTIVFDEADDILKNSDIVVQMKPLLDTSGDNTMEYAAGTASMIGKTRDEIEEYSSWVDSELSQGKYIGTVTRGETVQIPSKFYFNGQIIFISNMPSEKIDSAIMSRSLFIDVQLCAEDINKRIHSIMRVNYDDLSDEEIVRIMAALGQTIPKSASTPNVQYMSPEIARKQKPVTIRSMTIAVEMMRRGVPNWERLAALYA